MKKTQIFPILLIATLLLAACAEAGSTTTTEPTLVPPTEQPAAPTPTAAPSPTPTATSSVDAEMLVGTTWMWTGFTDPTQQFDVEMPENYTITFNQDDTVNIVSDCNNAIGSYTLAGSSLTIAVGPMTLAACPLESRSDQFVKYLGSAAIYFFEESSLYIDLMADAGTMTFTPSGEVDMTGDLQASPWQWVSFTNPVEQYQVENPQNYVLTFNDDGTLNIVADCNNASGSYTTDGSSLTIEVGPMTMAACPPESRSDDFVKYLGASAIYFFQDGNLYIDLFADSGTMMFTPTSEEATQGTLPADIVAQLDAYLQSQVYTEGGNFNLAAPGLVLLVDTPEGRYLNAAGAANLEDGTPMQVDDILQIGSNTKSMTIVLLMQLVEEGILTLDDPLSQWLPEQAASLPNGDQITIRQLARHTAGIWDYGDPILSAGLEDPALAEQGFTPAELIEYAIENGTPDFAPGEAGQWNYSNTGYILLGMILEQATGQPLTDLYQTRIFDPLGLESAVLIKDVPTPQETSTHGYAWRDNGEMVDATNWNGSQAWAAGSVAMTAADFAAYCHALGNGELLQQSETLTQMLDFNPDSLYKLGAAYGMGLMDFAGDGSVWGHEGATSGFQSLWYTDPEAEILVVGLTNSGNYSGFNFLNVHNILNGEGAKPFGPVTLLPVGDIVATTWVWTQFVTPV